MRIVTDGHTFLEGPRWRDGRLVMSDFFTGRVLSVDPASGEVETVVQLDGDWPSGLGWLPDGRLLVVSMQRRQLLRQEPDGGLVVHADLSELASFHCNDMVVDATGRAYVGNFGFDLNAPDPQPAQAELIRVDPDGTATVEDDDMAFPNGSVVTPDGSTLIVGQSMGSDLVAFTIGADGSLSDRRVWADLGELVPDGICLDAEGAVWFADPRVGGVHRVAEGGELLQTVDTDRPAFACMLGGDERRTLFALTSASSHPDAAPEARSARVEAVEVDVPGAGLP
ncbi:MAG: SMP-30/gluconolactonase/LRE family protein [Actinomycetota bacterium]